MPKTVQFRRYTINKGRIDDFVAAWRQGVVPLRRRFGFAIDGAWAIRERGEFLWLVSCAGGVDDFKASEAAYYASPQRAALDPDPAQWIARAEQWFVTPALE